jgi:hypothetical protein
MWCTVLVLSLVTTVDPVRLGISVLLYSRPRPVPHLVALWLGGVTISTAVALGVLFGLRDFALGVMHKVQLATASSTAGHIQIAMGVLALLIAGVAGGFLPRPRVRLAIPGTDPSHLQPLRSTLLSRLSARAQDALKAGPLWVTFVLGFGMLADLKYLAALTAILASGSAAGTQVGATGLYAVVALAFVEIPLASQLASPAKTGQVMSAVHGWLKARRHQVIGALLTLLGVLLMTTGMGHI